MSKIDLDPITSGYNLSKINANFQKIEDELNNKVLYRNSPTGEPNGMSSNLDMNGNKILNVVTGTSPSDLATRGYVDEEIAEERVYVDQQLYLVNSELDTKYDKTGGPVFGDINLNGHKLIGASEVQTSKTSTSILEINGVPVVPGNSVIDPYNGTREALRRSYAEAGYNLVDGSFEAGGTLVNANDVLLQERTGKAFSGPVGTVAAGTNPASGGFVDKSGGLLRHELATSFAPNDKIYLANYSHLAVGTDWTSAILAALNDVPITGAEIVLPAGSFEHDAITISKRVKITGQGTHAVAGNSPSQLVKKSTVSGSGIIVETSGCHFEGFALKGADGNAGDGLEILNGRFSATDFAVYSMGRDGIRIGNDNPIYNTNGFCLTNIKSKGNGRHGLHVSDKVAPTLPDASGGSVFFADLQDNRECGLYLGNCFVNTFTGLLVQKNGTYGVRCTPSSSYNYFYGGDYEVNGRPAGVAETSYLDFWIEAGSKRNKIIGGNCYNFPISFQCDEPENLIIGMNDGVFAGDNKYAGIQLMNKESPIPTFLDYYKEGYFTPVVIGRTSAGTATYTTQVGKFTRIGNVVNFTINVNYSGHTGTGNMAIIGLPFTSKSDTSTAVSVYSFGLAKPLNSYITALVVGGDAGVTLYSAQSDSIAATGVAIPIDPAASVNVSGFYFV